MLNNDRRISIGETHQQEDYILRIIRQILLTIATLARHPTASQQQEALDLIEEAYLTLFGINAWMIPMLSPGKIVELATESGERQSFITLLEEEAKIRRNMGESAIADALDRRLKALEVAG